MEAEPEVEVLRGVVTGPVLQAAYGERGIRGRSPE